MNHPDDRSPEQIEQDIERKRADVSSTLDAIQGKLTPGQMMDQALDYLRHSGAGDFGSNLGRSVRDNPMPVALMGIGLAWLMASGRGHARTDGSSVRTTELGLPADPYPPRDVLVETELDAVIVSADLDDLDGGHSSGRMAEAGHRMREGAHHMADRARGVGQGLKERAASAREGSRERIDQARGAMSELIDRQPLVLAALGIALGAALGAALPPSRREDRLMGSARDEALRRARQKADEQAGHVREKIHRAGDEAERRLDERSAPRREDAERLSSAHAPSAHGLDTGPLAGEDLGPGTSPMGAPPLGTPSSGWESGRRTL